MIPLHAIEVWFSVMDDKYKGKGLKCPEIDMEAQWEWVIKSASRWAKGMAKVLEMVQGDTIAFVGALGTMEIHNI